MNVYMSVGGGGEKGVGTYYLGGIRNYQLTESPFLLIKILLISFMN